MYKYNFSNIKVDLKSMLNESTMSVYGIDLREYYLNVEWDIMSVVAFEKMKKYNCCPEPYPNLFFNITMRRKTLFYMVNLIIPCLGISGLSVLVFYLPSDSGEKVRVLSDVS